MGKQKIKVSKKTFQKFLEIKDELNRNAHDDLDMNKTLDQLIMHYKNSQIKKSKVKEKNIPPISKIPAPKLNNSSSSNTNDAILSIPPTPKKKPIKLEINKTDLEKLAKRETDDIKYILIECNICGNKPITMPVPKNIVLNSKDPVVDISFVHGDPKHVLVAQLDHDFQVRRRRVSWVVFEDDYK